MAGKDKSAYQKALTKIKYKKYRDAAAILMGILDRNDGTAFGDCVKVLLSDCYLKEIEGVMEDPKAGVRLLSEAVGSGRYSPMLFDAFLKWRTALQAREYGMANTSGIPNQDYNRKLWDLVLVARTHLADKPDDEWAKNQINLLVSLPNITRGGTYGNSNLNYYAALYMEPDDGTKKADKKGAKAK